MIRENYWTIDEQLIIKVLGYFEEIIIFYMIEPLKNALISLYNNVLVPYRTYWFVY